MGDAWQDDVARPDMHRDPCQRAHCNRSPSPDQPGTRVVTDRLGRPELGADAQRRRCIDATQRIGARHAIASATQ
ncbi:hypothetical protein XcodCFBP4690_18115 [Xanthomonas codiaei]|uniref:Uncharacterized protein n=1 Tax=Xanthomonas codiaei TaxID=56463 RepID=A0A2S7CEX7_9XANT|nr:hypothetical protein XcodCFBP4690_18115 [Xanthomonas codiaei]